jgi:hypothetical protein
MNQRIKKQQTEHDVKLVAGECKPPLVKDDAIYYYDRSSQTFVKAGKGEVKTISK